MRSSTSRLSLLGVVFGAAAVAVVLHLGYVMCGQHEQWEVLGYRNRWTFRDVPTHRGAITDRFGTVLVHDVPTFTLAVDYYAFRRGHPVGAAVHGATLLAEHDERLQGREFTYGRSAFGAEVACAEMMALPVTALRPVRGDNGLAQNLRFYGVALLAGCSGRRAAWVNRAITQALAAGRDVELGDCLPGIPRAALLDAFSTSISELDTLDLALPEGHGRGKLLTTLDGLRKEWPTLAEDKQRKRRIRPIADRLPFDVAAALRTGANGHPGLLLDPSVMRVRSTIRDGGSALDGMLGSVKPLKNMEEAEAEKQLGEAMDEMLSPDEIDELVPADSGPEAVRRSFQDAAQDWFRSMLRQRGRFGTSGLEAATDDSLAGTPGLRLVERDKRSREQQMLSYAMQVYPGADVALSIDLDLQRVVEDVAEDVYRHWQNQPGLPSPDELDVGVAIVDAGTGEILAIGGQPLRLDGKERALPPGLNWRTRGDIGSTCKPFVQLEQFAAERAGRPHSSSDRFRDCTRSYGVVQGHKLTCDGSHGRDARDPVRALAESCNFWFFTAAEGLGDVGLERAFRRFGLTLPEPEQPEFGEDTWQARPFGASVPQASRPRVDGNQMRQLRGIGYGVQASPVMVARAYGALATGQLRRLTLVTGQGTGAVALDVPPEDLAIVQQGLHECVVDGTAKGAEHVELLRQYEVVGKTGTAEVDANTHENNALFAGYLPYRSRCGAQLAFCTAVYRVPSGKHGGEVAAEFLAQLLQAMQSHPELRQRYLLREGG